MHAEQAALIATPLIAADKGRTWFNTTTDKMMYWNGTSAEVLASVGGAVTSVTASAPLLSSGGTTPNISMPAATTAVHGYLTSNDFTIFNNKQTAGNYITALSGDVTGSGPGVSSVTIAC